MPILDVPADALLLMLDVLWLDVFALYLFQKDDVEPYDVRLEAEGCDVILPMGDDVLHTLFGLLFEAFDLVFWWFCVVRFEGETCMHFHRRQVQPWPVQLCGQL